MRRLATALLALAALTFGTAPLVAHAQDKAKPPITKEQRDKGMKDAPAAVQKAGLTCTVSDAYFLGASNGADKADIYEVACQQGPGYVVLAGPSTTKAYDCLATMAQPSLACRLPANADPKQGLKTYISTAGVTCTPTNARYMGSNATTSVYEVACQEGPGFVLETPAPGVTSTPVQAIPCIQAPANMACTLTTKAQNDAYLVGLVGKAGRTCQISASRYIGTDKTSNAAYFEVGCGAQPGFVLAVNKTGGVDRVLSCAQAQGLGGCTFTSSAQMMAADTANYTRMAKASGFDCDVSKYRDIGLDASKNEIVELACSNRPDGVVAVFPATAGAGRTQFVDCVKAGEFGESGACTLTSAQPVYNKYTAALAAKGRSSCKVSGARYLGRSPSGTDFVETACADGKPGWVIELTQADQVKELLSCGQAKGVGLSCQLPTNAKG